MKVIYKGENKVKLVNKLYRAASLQNAYRKVFKLDLLIGFSQLAN